MVKKLRAYKPKGTKYTITNETSNEINLCNTLEWDLVMRDIDKIDKIKTFRKNFFDLAFDKDIKKTKSSNKQLKKLRNDHFVKYEMSNTGRNFLADWKLNVQEFFSNNNKYYNYELFELLKITIFLNTHSSNFTRNLGLYYHNSGNIKINTFNVNGKKTKNHVQTASHELGHAWSYQLCHIAGINPESAMQEANISFGEKLFESGVIDSIGNRTINNVISWYAATANKTCETFAEIFAISTGVVKKSNEIISAAKFAIEYFNTKILNVVHNSPEKLVI